METRAASSPAAQIWVSRTGSDTAAGSRTAPCKTLAAALEKVAPGGEIRLLGGSGDPGPVKVTKAVTIDGGSDGAELSAGVTTGIVVEAGAQDAVVLRGLQLKGTPGGDATTNGVRFLSGGSLRVEKCVLSGWGGFGIEFAPTAGAAKLAIAECTVRENRTGGVLVKPTAPAASATATIEKTQLDKNQFNLRVEAGAKVTIKGTTSANAKTNGILVFTAQAAPTAEVDLIDSVAKGNGTNGIKSEGPGSSVRLQGVVVTANHTGLNASAGGAIVWQKNNRVMANGAGGNGSPTATEKR